jgi:NAD(P)-dependent dehydrogenase (short-subunit alcohol dehydrogenase family)
VKFPQHLTDDDWDAVYETNLRGAWVLAQEIIKRRLADQRECSIINIASLLGLRGIWHVAPYAAAKAGFINLGRDLSTDLAKNGVRVNAIAPGYIETEMNQEWPKTDGGERLRKKFPQNGLAYPPISLAHCSTSPQMRHDTRMQRCSPSMAALSERCSAEATRCLCGFSLFSVNLAREAQRKGTIFEGPATISVSRVCN